MPKKNVLRIIFIRKQYFGCTVINICTFSMCSFDLKKDSDWSVFTYRFSGVLLFYTGVIKLPHLNKTYEQLQ